MREGKVGKLKQINVERENEGRGSGKMKANHCRKGK
jgi:hypothetical protein